MVVRTSVAEADDGTRLIVRSRPGDPSLPAFLLVHGLSSNARLWDGVAEGLEVTDHASFAVDLRGHGESEKPAHGYDFAGVAADVAAVVRDVVGRRAILVGQSWGANVVVEAAGRFPEIARAVACIDGGYISLSDSFADWEAAKTQLTPPSFSGFTEAQLRTHAESWFAGFPEAGVEAQLANFVLAEDGTVRPRLALANHLTILEHLWTHDPLAAVAAVHVPVWVMAVHGGWDDKPRRVSDFVAAARQARVVWTDGHHDVHAQDPTRVVDFLLDLSSEVAE